MNSNGTNKSYQACSIILLKIDFESIINLGGENTHLDSKLEDPIPWPIGLPRPATMVVVVGGSDRLRRMVVVLRSETLTH